MADLLRELSRALPGLRASADEPDRIAYARDLWPRRHLAVRAGTPAESRPAAIVWPSSTEDVARTVRWARGEGVPVVPFGAGSGVCAGIAPGPGVVVMDLKRMAHLRAIDVESPFVEVEAGHMGLPLEERLGRAGFTLGHFPSSILCSTVGGWIAARSAGQCSSAYGKIEDMVVALECVTGEGEIVTLRRRTSAPDLVPLVVGSEGTLAVVTSATLRLHPAPESRDFGAWSFPTMRQGWEAMRELFQAGLRPAVARLYDPFDAMLARQGSSSGSARREEGAALARTADLRGSALRLLLRRPGLLNDLLGREITERALGGSLLVTVFEGPARSQRADPNENAGPARSQRTDPNENAGPARSAAAVEQARAICERSGGRWEGDGPARRWLARRYAVSYRQAPVFAHGAFVDTMEVAARWSKLGDLYEGVRRALGEHVFVMAHLSHGYPDGCCIYFSFAGSADPGLVRERGWDGACEATYDRAWRAALAAAVEAGGTLAHHHGVGRSKAPRLAAELGAGIGVVRSLMQAFDPAGILNPGNLLPAHATAVGRAPAVTSVSASAPSLRSGLRTSSGELELDRESLLARIEGSADLATIERLLRDRGVSLGACLPEPSLSLADWLARGAPGARDRWLDPPDQLLAGLDGTLANGVALSIRPAPRRSVGPDLTALFVGAGERFGRVDRAWMRVHVRDAASPPSRPFAYDRDPPLSESERRLVDAIARSLLNR
jgi:alkyldihydroxyacetonephosphate synthase